MNIFQDIKSKLEKGFEQAGHQSQRVLDVSRLNMKIKSKKDELAEGVDKLGWVVFESWDPNEMFTLTDEVKKALKYAHETEQQLVKLEGELDQLKNSNIKTRVTAETVKLPLAHLDEQPQKQTRKVIAKVVYLCAYCVTEVSSDVEACPHCNESW